MSKSSNIENKTLKYWQVYTLCGLMLGYAMYYLTRQNFSFAIPSICNEFGLSKTEIGHIISIGAIMHGTSKLIFGFVGDRYNAHCVIAFGLLISGIANICLGFSNNVSLIFTFFILNQYFQSMGSPACAKIVTNWFTKKETSTIWGIWTTSIYIGKLSIAIIAPILISYLGWRATF